MSLINFSSERESNKRREEIRTARERTLKKAEAEFYQKKLEEERRRQRGDDKWMAPSVESRVRESSKSDKHKKSKKKKEKKKKEKKKKAKKKKHQSDSSSSDSDGEDDDEAWVEKTDEKKEDCGDRTVRKDNVPQERDAWMIPTADISNLLARGTDNTDIRGGIREKPDNDRLNLDMMGQSSRELNPYWKDGGTGLPEDQPQRREPAARQKKVGDGGAEWLRHALRRAEEQAAAEGRPLEEVAAERWGSLRHLQDMIATAEGQRDSGRRRPAFRRPAEDGSLPSPVGDRRRMEERGGGEGGHLSGADSHRERRGSPDGRDSDRRRDSGRSYGHRDHRRPERAAWKKSDVRVVEEKTRGRSSTPTNAEKTTRKQAGSSSDGSSSESAEEKGEPVGTGAPLTDLEMNELAAKLVKAEILGNEELVSQLRAKLDAARASRKAGDDDKHGRETREEEEIVVLTRTDAKGNVRPAAAPSFALDREADLWGGRRGRKANKKKTHDSKGQRVQYFADDSKFSLQDLYQREKFISAADQQAEFVKLSAKGVEGGAAETGRPSADAEHRRAVSDSRWVAKALESCRWCLGGRQLQKHLIAALGDHVYLCVPPHRSIVEGHCLLIPSQHVSCSTQLDENVWDEMQRFRKALVAMFLGRGLDVVFFETAVHLSKMPHMVLECVPVPKEAGDMAPVYFKKAIMECEMEWSMNKKLVDLDGSKNVRRAIPRGLPYFWVGFGNEDKFAHIIEDEKHFPKNFAQEIVGGMLDIDHMLWRKPKMENFDAQRQKVMQLVQWWKPHDFTRGTKRSHDSSSSSPSSSSSDSE
ncbi:CWF19-like protein 2 [Schistocerca gregaria]|uniref:CWF19-like protein 2 n=1 Tax=Schistocerca gregaria TaxID=7010 RepID=UPI00211F40F9|nr:CWF19-like protein 2 [Schistocerca gregaria]XP_049841025.1 CWF19-like protein 2 [Schistocerca gregaria]